MMSYQSYREKMFMISSINKIWCIYSLKRWRSILLYFFKNLGPRRWVPSSGAQKPHYGCLQGLCIRPLYKVWPQKVHPKIMTRQSSSFFASRKVVTLKFSTCQITLSFLQLSVGRLIQKTCFVTQKSLPHLRSNKINHDYSRLDHPSIHQTKNYKLGLDFLSFYVNKAV